MKNPLGIRPAGVLALALLAAPAWPAEIHDAARAGDLAKVQALAAKDAALVNAKDDAGRTPLHWACRGVHIEVVEFLAGRGADVDAQDANGVRPLHSVSSRGHVGAARALLDRGASVEARMPDGSTPLHLAAANGHADLAALLVDRGALPGVQDDREDTPLQAAAREGKWEVVGLLAERVKPGSGGGLDSPDFDGATLLHLASEAGRLDIVRLLVSKGAAIDARTTLGLSALNLAEEGGFKEVAEFLGDKGADRGPQRFPELEGPYLGQTPPGPTPRLFAKGIVSTRRGMYGTIVFSPDGREAYWKPEGPEMLFMRLENGVWTPPRGAPFMAKDTINVPFFSHDGRRLYFMAASRGAQGMDEREAIWLVEKEGAGWSEPKPFDAVVNSMGMHWQFALDRAGNVYLSSNGGINRVRYDNGRYAPPEPLPAPVNIPHTEEEKYRAGEVGPFISPEGDYLIYSRFRAGAPLPCQLMISFKNSDGSWSEPKNLSEKLQTEGNDSMAKVTPDGQYLFFQSDRRGSGASRGLYWVDAKVIDELKPPQK
jgi:ankyrin repeat protein